MYAHPATQASIEKLRSYGVTVLETAAGHQACGDIGLGRLLEPEQILAEIRCNLKVRSANASLSERDLS
jgi:phosphopantothenoylcysteine synthetase/decarboxylase